MGRATAFDRDHVLDRALAVFWRHGYAATSMRDVAAATGLGPGSLYNAFGDKRGLFSAVLTHYRAHVSAPLFAPLDQPDAGLAAIERVFERLARPDASAPAPGCLVTNSLCEFDGTAPPFELTASLVQLEARLEAALRRAQASDELAAGVEPATAATFLVALAQGLRVMARAGEPPLRLSAIARTGLAGLRAPTSTNPPRSDR